MANLKVLIESVDSSDIVQDLIDRQKPASNEDMINFLSEYLQVLQRGQKQGSVLRFSSCDVQASATAQCVSVIEDDTITIGSKVLTAKDAPASQDEFLVGANDGETADNLADCINANSDLQNFLSGVSDGTDTVTLTSLVAGSIGNNIPLSSSGATIVLSDSFLVDGTDSNNKTVET